MRAKTSARAAAAVRKVGEALLFAVLLVLFWPLMLIGDALGDDGGHPTKDEWKVI